MWKGTPGPGRPTRLQSLPTLPGSDACGIKHHGAEEVLFPCSLGQFKHLLALCVPKQVCQEWTPRLALPQLGCELVSPKLDATASRKHKLKHEIQGLIRFALKGWYWHFQTSQFPACCFLLVWNWISVFLMDPQQDHRELRCYRPWDKKFRPTLFNSLQGSAVRCFDFPFVPCMLQRW